MQTLKVSFSHIPILYTFESQIRSVAFAHHAIMVEQANKQLQEGFECAIYYEPYANNIYPDTLDAIFLEILAGQTGYNIAGFAVFPDRERREIKINEWYSDYAKAKQVAINWILAARELVFTH